jgi:hypothetical protein
MIMITWNVSEIRLRYLPNTSLEYCLNTKQFRGFGFRNKSDQPLTEIIAHFRGVSGTIFREKCNSIGTAGSFIICTS